MTSEIGGNVPNPFLIYWIEVNKNFYENAIKTNEQSFKAFWDLWLKAGRPERKETAKVE